MKVKITQSGWAGYTGFLGTTEFADGVSVNELSPHEADRLGALVTVEKIEGGQVGISQTWLEHYGDSAPVGATLDRGGEGHVVNEPAPVVPRPLATESRLYSRADLETVAEGKGIQGLREIAGPMGIKATSITTMIDKILQAQGNFERVDLSDGEPVQAVLSESQVKADLGEPSAEQKARLGRVQQ